MRTSSLVTWLVSYLACPLLAVCVFVLLATPALAAPNLQLSPATASIENGTTKTFTVTVDAETQSAFGSDAIIKYDPAKVDVVGLPTNGGFFTDFNPAVDGAAGRIELHGFFSSLNEGKSGTGTFASFVIRTKIGTGTGTLSFLCGGSGGSTNLLDTSGQNILACGSLNQSALTFTGSSQLTPTATSAPNPTNTNAPNPTNTVAPTPVHTPVPTATSAPQNPQNNDPACTGLSVSPSGGKKPLTATLLCSGNDTDGDITAAEFNFGDGVTKVVEKNVGGFGSISTTHVYTSANKFTVTCRVRDNASRFSAAANNCNRSLSVTSPPSATARPNVEVINYVPAATPIPTLEVVPTGPQMVELSVYKPPVPNIDVPPAETASEQPAPTAFSPRYIVGIAIIVLSLIAGLILIKKGRDHARNSSPPKIVAE